MMAFGRAVRPLRFAVACIGIFGVSDALAEGGPPLLTDDPGTPGNGNWEINFAWTSERTSNSNQDELPLIDINYGVGERAQLKFEMPWVAQSGRADNGFGNALIGIKWRFLDQGEGGWQMSTYPQIEFAPPALHHAESTESGVSYLLPIEIERDFGSFDAGFEVGHTFASSRDEEGWIAGIDVGRKVSERVEILGEVHDETADGTDAHELILNVGARGRLSEHLTLLLSLGGDIDNTIGPRNRWISYLGLQLTP